MPRRRFLSKHFFINSSSNLRLNGYFARQGETAHWSYAATHWLDPAMGRILGAMRSFTPAWLIASELTLGRRRSLWRRMSDLFWRTVSRAHW